MGYTRHHAIVVTSCDARTLARAYASIRALPGLMVQVSPITPPTTEGYQSFLVAPDGSKHGWAESLAGNADRERIVQVLESFAFDDGSSMLAWVEVRFGDDDRKDRMVRSSRVDGEPDTEEAP